MKIDVTKSFEVDLLDRPFWSKEDLFITNCLVEYLFSQFLTAFYIPEWSLVTRIVLQTNLTTQIDKQVLLHNIESISVS